MIRMAPRAHPQPLLPFQPPSPRTVRRLAVALDRSPRPGGRCSSPPERATAQSARTRTRTRAIGAATGERANARLPLPGVHEVATTILALLAFGLAWVGFEAGRVNAELARAERARSVSLLAQSGPALRLASGYAGEARMR